MADILCVDDLHKSFFGVEVLRGISLAAGDGDVVSIIGASGSGKSTFLRCIPMLEIPDAGSITVAGETLRMRETRRGPQPADAAQVNRIRGKLGFVFQSFNLWSHMTVLQNII
ncbi:ATP-binding cassette domain-containing protein, partial [Mycobacterium tuberculosis]|nr:ATP-binding cassette domain-containing protein [Mycobacterium tuberculosis]